VIPAIRGALNTDQLVWSSIFLKISHFLETAGSLFRENLPDASCDPAKTFELGDVKGGYGLFLLEETRS
jgi:hypothetical protein